MLLANLLTVDRIRCNAQAASKKRVLEQLGALLAGGASLTPTEVFNSLLSRERLGSTGLGHGVAIPHARMKGNELTAAAFIKLEQGVDFDAVDGEPVDLVFGLLVPEASTEEHLTLLAHLAEMFSDKAFVVRLRAAASNEEIHRLLTQWRPGAA